MSTRFCYKKNAQRIVYTTFSIITLNLKVKAFFSQNLPPGLSILSGPFT